MFNEQVAPKLKENAVIVVASGYNVFYKLLKFSPKQDVVMVAPRMIGSSVRSLYQKGKGFPCFVSVEQDGTGSGLPIALALSRGIGATKAGAIASSAKEETAMDLFAEQALWPNIIMLFREAFSVLKEAGCSDEALCYEMYAFPITFSPMVIDECVFAGGCQRSLLKFSKEPLKKVSFNK